MKHLFIVNPAAGKGKALSIIPRIEKVFREIGETYTVKVSEWPGHAVEIAREYSSKEKHWVYSVGGDGTVNEVLNGIVNSDSSLAVIPCGTGNDFFRTISDSKYIDEILYHTVKGKERRIDLGKVNDKFFINISSVGFDASVAYSTGKIKRIPFITGSMAYIAGIVTTVVRNNSYELDIEINNDRIRGRYLLVAIANGKYYGGGMIPAPAARIDDGIFDACIIKAMSRNRILRLFPKYIKGEHEDIEEVSLIKGSKVTIQSSSGFALSIDGEVSKSHKAVFEIIPSGISVVIPTVREIEHSQLEVLDYV